MSDKIKSLPVEDRILLNDLMVKREMFKAMSDNGKHYLQSFPVAEVERLTDLAIEGVRSRHDTPDPARELLEEAMEVVKMFCDVFPDQGYQRGKDHIKFSGLFDKITKHLEGE